MYVSITGNKGNQDVYIKQSYRKDNGKTSSRIYKKLGKYNTLLEQFSGNEKELMDWAKKEAEKETLAYNQQKEKVSLSLSPLARIPLDEERVFNIGYLFLQKICSELRMDNICRNIRNHHKFSYDFQAILTDLIYTRILAPSSKLSSYKYCHSLLEPPKYSLQDLYRVPYPFSLRNPTLFRKNYTRIPTLFIHGILRFYITIAQTIISRLKLKMV